MPFPETHVSVLQGRRARLSALLSGPAVLGSGIPRVRNFEANRYPFRSESHFLYFVGQSLEESLLVFDGEGCRLYVPPPQDADALWYGKRPSLDELADQIGLPVLPLAEFAALPGAATIPPDDAETAAWLDEHLQREVLPGTAQDVVGADAALADALIELRLRHDESALRQIEWAVAVSSDAHRAGLRALAGARHEADVRAAMESVITAADMVPAYQSIVTTRGEVLHNEFSRHLLPPGGLLLADVGAETREGWAGDLTRTWPVSGRFSSLQREIYTAVLRAHTAAVAAIAPGVRYRDVHLAAAKTLLDGLCAIGLLRGEPESLLARGVSAVFFPHGIGHLLGLDVHDMEDLGDRAGYGPGVERSPDEALRFLRLDRPLEPNMVVTVEPGFYCIESQLARLDSSELRGCVDAEILVHVRREVRGIRIEDDVCVSDTGARVLSTSLPRSPDEIEAAWGR